MGRVRSWNPIAVAGVLMALAPLMVACGVGQGSTQVLSATEAKLLLLELPYRYHFRAVALPRGASGALAGTAIGRHHTVLHFGIALGHKPYPVPVPQAGTKGVYGYGGYVYTDDILVPGKREKWEAGPQFHTEAQWREGNEMEVQMEEKLCRAETGEPCHEG